jgi:hypothetical protein
LQPARTHSLPVALTIVIFIASAPHAQAQLRTSAAKLPAKAEPRARIDPLERETPRSAMISFLKYALREYDESKKKGWTVISMKNDWKTIFSFDK